MAGRGGGARFLQTAMQDAYGGETTSRRLGGEIMVEEE